MVWGNVRIKVRSFRWISRLRVFRSLAGLKSDGGGEGREGREGRWSCRDGTKGIGHGYGYEGPANTDLEELAIFMGSTWDVLAVL